MKLRTTLAAAPAVALLALATCADPPIPTVADPAGLGAEASALPSSSAPGAASTLADQGECRILSTHGTWYTIGPKEGRPDPDSASTFAAAEGDGPRGGTNVFWPDGCPGGNLNLQIEYARGLNGTLDPGRFDFLLWRARYEQRWFMTYSPFVEQAASYEIGLELVHYDRGVKIVHASRIVNASWAATQKCWFYRHGTIRGLSPRDSEVCKVPFAVRPWLIIEEAD